MAILNLKLADEPLVIMEFVAYFVKENVSLHEYNMHNYIYANFSTLINVPKIESYNRKTKQLTMQKIPALNVADFYGESMEAVPPSIIAEVRKIIKVLDDNHIVYPDITGYNFIVDYYGTVWIIDFEHCYFDYCQGDPFVKGFINGSGKSWNPDFR